MQTPGKPARNSAPLLGLLDEEQVVCDILRLPLDVFARSAAVMLAFESSVPILGRPVLVPTAAAAHSEPVHGQEHCGKDDPEPVATHQLNHDTHSVSDPGACRTAPISRTAANDYFAVAIPMPVPT